MHVRGPLNLLYGKRRRGEGPQPPRDLTELFLREALELGFERRSERVFRYLQSKHKMGREELLLSFSDKELNEMAVDVAYDKAIYRMTQPIGITREKQGDEFVIQFSSSWDAYGCVCVVDKVIEQQGEVQGKANFHDIAQDLYVSVAFDELYDFESHSLSHSFNEVMDFLYDAYRYTQEAVNEGV